MAEWIAIGIFGAAAFLAGAGDSRDGSFAMLHEAIPAIMPVPLLS